MFGECASWQCQLPAAWAVLAALIIVFATQECIRLKLFPAGAGLHLEYVSLEIGSPWKFAFGIAFGISDALGIFAKTSQIGFLPTEFFNALPYILIIVLTICRKKLNMPAKLGTNYIKEN